LLAALSVGFLRFREEYFTFTSDLEIYYLSTRVMQAVRAALQVRWALNSHRIALDGIRTTHIFGYSSLILIQIVISLFSYEADFNAIFDALLQVSLMIIILSSLTIVIDVPDFIPEDLGWSEPENERMRAVKLDDVAASQSLYSTTKNCGQDQQTLSMEPTHLCDGNLRNYDHKLMPERGKPPPAAPPDARCSDQEDIGSAHSDNDLAVLPNDTVAGHQTSLSGFNTTPEISEQGSLLDVPKHSDDSVQSSTVQKQTDEPATLCNDPEDFEWAQPTATVEHDTQPYVLAASPSPITLHSGFIPITKNVYVALGGENQQIPTPYEPFPVDLSGQVDEHTPNKDNLPATVADLLPPGALCNKEVHPQQEVAQTAKGELVPNK
jgi:hypothetical protein